MGNDGGSIPDRRDLVRSKPKAEQADKANQTRAKWLFCALSKRPLQEPIVSCALGKLYNKDAILEYLLDKSAYGDGENICGHIRSLKDVKTLKLTPNTSPAPSTGDTTPSNRASFVCPLTMKEMNGGQPFLYISTCGCVFSQSGYRTVASSSPSSSSPSPPPKDKKEGEKEGEPSQPEPSLDLCPQCGAKYNKATDVRTLNPSPEEEETMREAMKLQRLAEPTKKSKKRKAAAAGEEDGSSSKKAKGATPTPATNPTIAATSRAVLEGLAVEEAKRKAGMSEVVKSLYGDKNAPKRKETFMTMGTFTRYA